MGKSKHRKNHKQKAAAYKKELVDGSKRYVKFLMEQRQKLIDQLNMVSPEEQQKLLGVNPVTNS
jgi:hypothetical protein